MKMRTNKSVLYTGFKFMNWRTVKSTTGTSTSALVSTSPIALANNQYVTKNSNGALLFLVTEEKRANRDDDNKTTVDIYSTKSFKNQLGRSPHCSPVFE